jgi:hypothetical protein
MRVNLESVLNEIDESELQELKHSEQRIWTWWGLVIDLREEQKENALDSMHVNSESVSNETDESNLQCEKHFAQRIWTWRGINIDMICFLRNARGSIRLTPSAAAGEGKKTHDGTMMTPPEPKPKSDLVAVTDPGETERVTPATTKEVSDILINCRNQNWESHVNWHIPSTRPSITPP